MDPTRSMGCSASLKKIKIKKVFEENLSPKRMVLFGVATYFLFLFIKGEIK